MLEATRKVFQVIDVSRKMAGEEFDATSPKPGKELIQALEDFTSGKMGKVED